MTENIFSIDVEEIFHAEYVRHTQKKYDYRTPQNIPVILDLLREYDITATFFVVGEILEKFPEIINMLKDEGHEISFQGWRHIPLWDMNVDTFKEGVEKFNRVHPNCMGFRAPSFSLSNETKWALDVIKEGGYVYDSSIFPARTPLYGLPSSPLKPYYPSLDDISRESDINYGIMEFPLAVYPLFGFNVPMAGGFWLRFWNTGIVERCIKKMNEKGLPAVIYVHNWELDPETPKIDLSFLKGFVTYRNLSQTVKKLKYLFDRFRFTSFKAYINSNIDVT